MRPTIEDIDLYSDAMIESPWDGYARIRDTASAVWLPQNNMWAAGRYADVRAILADHDGFISSKGVSGNDLTNSTSQGNTLVSDPPDHTLRRGVISRPLHPRALRDIQPRIEAEANRLIEDLLSRDSFDAMTDLAQHLPLTIVSDLVGIPEAGRTRMLDWAAATFDAIGGDNARTDAARPRLAEMRAFMTSPETQAALKPGGWAAQLFQAADAGEVDPALCPTLMRDYLGPSLDTTIFATGHIVRRLAETPGAWDRLRAEPRLIGNAINEAVRVDSPIRTFTRVAARDIVVGDVPLSAGDRIAVLYASGNRDPRHWDNPDVYDLDRNANTHLGFGHGIHACVGMQLARLEMRALLEAMIARVATIETGTPVQAINNVLYGFEALPARFIPDGQ
ncbi:MAG: cytochrome P450 [Paracoccaceae bacterium]